MKHIIIRIDTTTSNYDDDGILADKVIEREIADLMGIYPWDIEVEVTDE